MRNRKRTHQQLSSGSPTAEQVEALGTEEILLRNYDHQWGYDIELDVLDANGNSVYEKQWYLPPGQVGTEMDALPSGEYEVRVTLDNHKQETLVCSIDATAGNTVVIEVGNGVMSVTEGLHS